MDCSNGGKEKAYRKYDIVVVMGQLFKDRVSDRVPRFSMASDDQSDFPMTLVSQQQPEALRGEHDVSPCLSHLCSLRRGRWRSSRPARGISFSSLSLEQNSPHGEVPPVGHYGRHGVALRLAPPVLARAVLVGFHDGGLLEAGAHIGVALEVRLLLTVVPVVLPLVKGHLRGRREQIPSVKRRKRGEKEQPYGLLVYI